MSWETAQLIIDQAADLGVSSLKMNWRGESTMNPIFRDVCVYARDKGVFVERITNSNFKFDSEREDIFEGLGVQTKVKVSYDSFNKEVFEKQRSGGSHSVTTRNLDIFHSRYRGSCELVIQAVRTKLNRDEDFRRAVSERWPGAKLSVRDVVEGRLERDIDDLKVRSRDMTERQSCLQAHVRLIFDWQGRPTVCCPDISNKLSLGSIHDTSMYDLFNSVLAQRLRAELKSKKAFEREPCKSCSSYETYLGFKPVWGS